MRAYSLGAQNITVAGTVITLSFFNPVAGTAIQVLRCWVSQHANATSAQQRIQRSTQVTSFPTLTSTTPAKTNTGDPVSGIAGNTAGAAGTCGTNASAEGAGAKTVIAGDAFNVLNGYLWIPTPNEVETVLASASAGYGLVFPAAPTTLTGWNFGLIFGEV